MNSVYIMIIKFTFSHAREIVVYATSGMCVIRFVTPVILLSHCFHFCIFLNLFSALYILSCADVVNPNYTITDFPFVILFKPNTALGRVIFIECLFLVRPLCFMRNAHVQRWGCLGSGFLCFSIRKGVLFCSVKLKVLFLFWIVNLFFHIHPHI